MKLGITAINVVSAIPILLYPSILVAGIMSFAAAGSDSVLGWLIFAASVGYPLPIIALILLSRRYSSISLASLALIPLFVLIYVLFISGFISATKVQKNKFGTLSKDFVCDSNSFLSLEGDHTDSIRWLQFLEKRNVFTYENNDIARVYSNTWINAERINPKHVRERTDRLLDSCKNTEGKTPTQVYSKVEDGQVREILKQI